MLIIRTKPISKVVKQVPPPAHWWKGMNKNQQLQYIADLDELDRGCLVKEKEKYADF